MTKPREYGMHERRDRRTRELVHDTYKLRSKLPEPTQCPTCGAVYHRGRWQWGQAPEGAHRHECPACLRIADRYPAGTLRLEGVFPRTHRDQVLRVATNVEARENREHPLERIMSIEDTDDAVVVQTTGTHLARGIGQALVDAFKGDLDIDYPEESAIVRVCWRR